MTAVDFQNTLECLSSSIEVQNVFEDQLKLGETSCSVVDNQMLFFNRLKHTIHKLKYSPSNSPNFKYKCSELKHELIGFISDFARLIDHLKDLDVNYPIDFNELVSQITSVFLFIGSFKHLPENLFENFRDCSKGEASVNSNALHCLLTIINCLYHVVYLLETSKLKVQYTMTPICDFIGKRPSNNQNTDECKLFIEVSYYMAYNLSYLHLKAFNQNLQASSFDLSTIDDLSTCPCDCVKANWLFLYKLHKSYEYHENSSTVFLQTMSTTFGVIKDRPAVRADYQDSNKLYFDDFNEHSQANIELFLILLQQNISESIETNKSIQKELLSYDNYKLIKSIIKDLTAKTTQMNENQLNTSFHLLFKLILDLIKKQKQLQLNQKGLIDILSSLWELYFSKQLNELKPINVEQSLLRLQNDLNSIQSTSLCQEARSNSFNFYLKLLALMLNNDESLWRLFKGRLYTRLHDKRIQELNLNAILNVSYLYLVLIKSIAKPVEAAQNLIRILNLFEEKHLSDDEQKQMFTAKRSFQLKSFQFNTVIKFLVILNLNLRQCEAEGEIQVDLLKDLTQKLKKCVDTHKQVVDENKNQLNFKTAQTANDNLCDLFSFYLSSLYQFLDFFEGEVLDTLAVSLLDELDVDYLHKALTKEQFFSHILQNLNQIVEQASAKTQKSQKLRDLLVKMTQKLTNEYFLKIQTQLQQSKEQQKTLISFYFHSTRFMSLSYDLTNKQTMQNKSLNDLLEQILFSSQNQNNSEACFLLVLRLKYAYKLLSSSDASAVLLQICEKKYQHFEHKLFNMAVNYYLQYDENAGQKKHKDDEFFEDVDSDDSDPLGSNRLAEFFFKHLFEKYNLFKQLNIDHQPNVELMLNDLVLKYSYRLKLIEDFQARKQELDSFQLYFSDFFRLINTIQSINLHSTIYKCYLLASQLIFNCSTFLYSRGRSDTTFAHIIDKMVLPRFLTPSASAQQTNAASISLASASSISLSNNQNSIWLSLKDTLHLFLVGISHLNYEYDGYLQRVIKSIIVNYTMKYQMSQLEDHFLLQTLERTFGDEPNAESKHYRVYLMRILKEQFLQDNKYNIDTEKILTLFELIQQRTQATSVKLNDAEVYLPSVLPILTNENLLLKTKAAILFDNLLGISNDNRKLFELIIQGFVEKTLLTCKSEAQIQAKLMPVLNSVLKGNKLILENNDTLKHMLINKLKAVKITHSDLKSSLFDLFDVLNRNENGGDILTEYF